MMTWTFNGREMGSYCLVEFADGVRHFDRDAVLTEEQFAKLTPKGKSDLAGWVAAGVVVAHNDEPETVREKRGKE